MLDFWKLLYKQLPILKTLKTAVDEVSEALPFLATLAMIYAIADLPGTIRAIGRFFKKLEEWIHRKNW